MHWIFWPALLWQMARAAARMEAWGCWDAMVRVRWWGGVELVYLGDRDPALGTYAPLAPAPALERSCLGQRCPGGD